MHRRRTVVRTWRVMGSVALAASLVMVGAVAAPASTSTSTDSTRAAQVYIRVNQVGYATASVKRAYVLSPMNVAGATFRVKTAAGGTTVRTGTVGASLGSWSKKYGFVSPIDFDGLTTAGSYVITMTSPAATSLKFDIGSGSALYGSLLTGSRAFFQTQRDGADVIAGALDRKPAHLNDATATAYAPPVYKHYSLKGDLKPVGGEVDVEGGWFDAGDYLKFVVTASYADALLLASVRDAPDLLGAGADADMTDEVRFGTDWLLSMWNDDTSTLYYQVGIGDGNGCGSICGDHDVWRLPEKDDTWGGDAAKWRYVRERPALRAGAPGAPISPNLAGRLAASFALCAQVFRTSDPAYASTCLTAGQHVYALADSHWKGQLLSASPHSYYPESQWRDDMELGATELAVATTGATSSQYLVDAAHYASLYLKSGDQDTLNVYDVGGLAHAELYRAIDAAGHPAGLEVSQAQLRDNLGAQIDNGVSHATRDPFAVGVPYGYDVASHLFGLVVEAADYADITGSSKYQEFLDGQLGAVFGANAWGVSLVVGAGEVFPDCMQHQVANLKGSLDGSAPIATGAVVNGPNNPSQFRGLGLPSGARTCPAGGGDPYKQFSGHGGRFVDNVTAWPSVEPAIDFTASSVLALARVATG